MPVWAVNLLIAVALQVVASLIMPRAGGNRPQQAEEMQSPRADAGSPVPVVYGTVRINGPNALRAGRKYRRTRKVKA